MLSDLPAAPNAPAPASLPLALKLFLGICFLLALAVRLYDLTDPPMDFHVDRQLTSMIKARGIYLQWRPDLPGWQQAVAAGQWKSMPHQEPEILEWVTAFAYRITGGEHLWIPRLFSICFWMTGGLAVFGLARALSGPAGATLATLTLGGAIFIAMFGVRESLYWEIDQSAGYYQADVNVEFTHPYPLEQAQAAIDGTPGVASMEGWSVSP